MGGKGPAGGGGDAGGVPGATQPCCTDGTSHDRRQAPAGLSDSVFSTAKWVQEQRLGW